MSEKIDKFVYVLYASSKTWTDILGVFSTSEKANKVKENFYKKNNKSGTTINPQLVVIETPLDWDPVCQK
jgi:hypothetical protein